MNCEDTDIMLNPGETEVPFTGKGDDRNPAKVKINVEDNIRYYNHESLHTALGNLTPINDEKLLKPSVRLDLA